MSQVPSELKYTKDHEWLRASDEGTATIGITDYAQNSLGDVTFVELPQVGASLAAGDSLGVVESVKAASDVYMPVSGEVVAVNEALADSPDLVNSDPYGQGWLVKVRLSAPEQVASLLGGEAYSAIV